MLYEVITRTSSAREEILDLPRLRLRIALAQVHQVPDVVGLEEQHAQEIGVARVVHPESARKEPEQPRQARLVRSGE